MNTELVRLDRAEGVATLVLDSPANRNALSARLRRDLQDGIEAALADDEVRVLVLTHTGPVFCSGADLAETGVGSGPSLGAGFIEILDLLWMSPKPVLARLAGPARAGGVGLVAACDLAVAADTVTFAFTEVRLGVIPAVISVPLRRRVPPGELHRLFLTGETFDARHAAAIGLLDTVAPAEGLDGAVAELVGLLLRGAPQALAGAKRLVRGGSLDAELEQMQELSAEYFASAEAQEGIRAFIEKRRPAWVPGDQEEPGSCGVPPAQPT